MQGEINRSYRLPFATVETKCRRETIFGAFFEEMFAFKFAGW